MLLVLTYCRREAEEVMPTGAVILAGTVIPAHRIRVYATAGARPRRRRAGGLMRRAAALTRPGGARRWAR